MALVELRGWVQLCRIAPGSCFPALRHCFHVFPYLTTVAWLVSSFDWFVALSTFVMIGQTRFQILFHNGPLEIAQYAKQTLLPKTGSFRRQIAVFTLAMQHVFAKLFKTLVCMKCADPFAELKVPSSTPPKFYFGQFFDRFLYFVFS